MKKNNVIISYIMVIIMLFSNGFTVNATENANQKITTVQKEAICLALEYVASDTDLYGLSKVNFESLQIGTAIPIYEYKNGEFNQFREYYPLIDGNHIVALAICVCDDKYMIETGLAKNIDKIGYTDIALIYDAQGVYIYNGYEIALLRHSDIYVSDRNTIDFTSNDTTFHEIDTVNILDVTSLGYTENNCKSGPAYYYSCGVSYVTQIPYDNLCWAATVACINNSINGTSLSAGDVSKAYFKSSTVVDSKLDPSVVAGFMNDYYSLDYTFHSYVPSDSVLVTNISNGYPVYGGFQWSDYYHATTIYGVNAVIGYISLMDPGQGVATALYNGSTYSYVSMSSGQTLSLIRGICHSW